MVVFLPKTWYVCAIFLHPYSTICLAKECGIKWQYIADGRREDFGIKWHLADDKITYGVFDRSDLAAPLAVARY